MWANNATHHFTRVLVKGGLTLLMVGSVAAAPAVVTTVHHHNNPPAPVKKVAVQPAKKVVAPTPKPQPAPAPAPTPTATPAPAKTQTASQAPQPIPASDPAPGSGAKSLTPTTSPPAAPATDPGTAAPTGDGLADATGGYSSTNWSGYVSLAGNYTAVSGSWVVPAVTGNGSTETAESSWIGIGGVFSQDLIQTGTMNIVAADGSVDTEAFYELLPDVALIIPSLHVSPGDGMSANIVEVATDSWTVTITDNATGKSFNTTVSYTSSHSSAEWIEEDPSYGDGTQVPYANFSTVSFSGGTATHAGAAGTIAANNGQAIRMVSSSTGQPIAVPSVLASNGSAFHVTRK
jgi:hypothetical protein